MRRAKLNASDIIAVLNDDSDLDVTWQPVSLKNAGQSDFSCSDSEEGQNASTYDDGNDMNNLNVKFNTNGIEVSTQLTSNIGWSQMPFLGVPLPEFNGPFNFIEIGSPITYVEKYLPDLHFEEAALYTNMYALSTKGKEFKATANEIKVFYGAQALMGIIKYPRFFMYWQRGIALDLISNAITRDRFLAIHTHLHYIDVNNRPPNNKSRFWKIQPLIEFVRNACRNINRHIGLYSIVEQMVPFTGRCPYRQFIKNKPRPVGLKNFVITTSSGMVLDFELYQGTETPFEDRSLGLGPAVVLHLSKTIPKGSVLFFDRYFTTVPLMNRLNEIGIYATGTIMQNRLKNVHFSNDKNFERGVWEEFTRADKKLTAIKWKDSKCVTMVSTTTGAEPHQTVKRWSKTENKEINVPCPAIVKSYNQNMGGVDLCNQQMEVYRTWFKSKKWTTKVAIHFIDLAIVNAWMEYKEDATKMQIPQKNIKDLMEFKISIAKEWLSTPIVNKRPNEDDYPPDVNEEPPNKVQNFRAPIPPEKKRYDGYDHWPESDSFNTAGTVEKMNVKAERE